MYKFIFLFGFLTLVSGHTTSSNQFCISGIDIYDQNNNLLDNIPNFCFNLNGETETDNCECYYGDCVNNVCECIEGYTGADCSELIPIEQICLFENGDFVNSLCNVPSNIYYSQSECPNGELIAPIWKCENNNTEDNSISKALYTWNPDFTRSVPWYYLLTNVNNAHSRYINFLNEWGFNKVMIYNGAIEWDYQTYASGQLNYQSDCVSLFSQLNSQGIEVDIVIYINDDINNLNGYEKAVDVVKAVKAFNAAYPAARISGIHLDQEPNNIGVYGDLLATFDLMKAEVGNYPLTINSAIKPLWLTQLYTDGRPFFQSVIDKTDNSMLMAYSNNPTTIRQWANIGLNYADSVLKLLDIAVETQEPSDNPPASDTLYSSIADGAHSSQFIPLITELNGEFMDYNNYGGLVIHHYSSYYHAINGVQPI